MSEEILKAGKATLTRTHGGTIKFVTAAGRERSVYGSEWDDLFEAIRDGSGEVMKTHRVDVVGDGSPRGRDLNGTRRFSEWRQQGAGGNWMFPHGDGNE